jgi:hypothetical protein
MSREIFECTKRRENVIRKKNYDDDDVLPFGIFVSLYVRE